MVAALAAAGSLAGCFERSAAPPATGRKQQFRVGEVFARTVTKRDIRLAHATEPQCKGCPQAEPGPWRAEVAGVRVILRGPRGSGGAVPITRIGAAYQTPAGTSLCRRQDGRAVGDLGRYRLSRRFRVVRITRISDGCHARAAVVTGTWRKVGGKFVSR